MPLLDILSSLDSVLENPAWIIFGLAVGLGALGLFLLLFIYPLAKDD